jgi:hypothetical protein
LGEKQKKDITGSKKRKNILQINETEPFEKLEGKFYNALDHEIRRTMLRMIGNDGLCSFTQFKKTLKVSTGTLYHHLDVLKDLVSQNKSRKYILTNLGKRALNFLVLNYESIEATNFEDQKLISNRFKSLLNLIPLKVMERIKEKPLIGWLITTLILILSFSLIMTGKIDSYFVFFLPYGMEFTEVTMVARFILGLKFIGSVVVTALVTEFLCRFLFGKNDNTMKFLSIYTLGLSPTIIYLIIYNIFEIFIPLLVDSIINKVIMIFFQIWAIWLISYIITVFKQIKIERSLLITFLIHYAAFSLLIFT